MENLKLTSFIKRANKFIIFNIILSVLIGVIFFIIGVNINDFSDYPNLNLNNKVNNSLNGLIEIFCNNAFIMPLTSLIIAIIPIPYLYMIPTISTIFSLSMAIGIQFAYRFNEGTVMLLGILPHGLLEIYIMSILLSLLFVLNKYIRNSLVNLFKKNKVYLPKFLNVITSICKCYLIVILPLTFICALIEVFITPNWFQFLKIF
ncbi:stage II sporulation protein M [Staphylococcus aureus]|uniref:stage II sporulation protein M n=1 Tax=Staphylococcus aureus TaxID=1280 RepID=UPI0018D9A950|nr:stage II sporulation protein M [Staphylococcus aureus]MBH4693529.1 stage II sporulation protein M [Staphylococcus aureus]MBH4696536.1 stage II sporulation protein M [Staphylococcus aureus]MBH4701509.1 stage II sporulation protein M [Staphylococcus aureus]MBH4704192.1 stage II sporulation protein M [Staphylococcus aureus]MBH4706450.1 stage II sporulation protein M [Staphylococcus aureus]